MSIYTSICVICGTTFEARHSYGLCKDCVTRERLHEYDRLQSAIHTTEKLHLPATLTLVQWLATISDFKGLCSFCLKSQFSYIHQMNRMDGLVWGNVVPICRSCQIHARDSFESAEMRVREYLGDIHRDQLLFHGEDEGIDRSCVPSDTALYGDTELLEIMQGEWS